MSPGDRAAVPPLKQQLLAQLSQIEGLQALPSKVAGGMALHYRGKEFAHFHNDQEIDLRLTRPLIKALGLVHPPRSAFHPQRSASSQWIELRFHKPADVQQVAELVRRAMARL